MREKEPIEKATSPNDRCIQTFNSGEQCRNKKIEGLDYCPAHIKYNFVQVAKDRETMYQITKNEYMDGLAKRLPEFTKDKYNLAQEIGILRLTLERTLNNIKNELDFLKYNQTITVTIEQLRKLTETAIKVDEKNKVLLGRDDVLALAHKLIEIIQKHVPDENVIHEIVTEFQEAVNDKYI